MITSISSLQCAKNLLGRRADSSMSKEKKTNKQPIQQKNIANKYIMSNISAANTQKHFISGTVNTTARHLEAETWSLKFPFWWNLTDEKLWHFQWFFKNKTFPFYHSRIKTKGTKKTKKYLTIESEKVSTSPKNDLRWS